VDIQELPRLAKSKRNKTLSVDTSWRSLG